MSALSNAPDYDEFVQEELDELAQKYTLGMFQALNRELNKRGLWLLVDVEPE